MTDREADRIHSDPYLVPSGKIARGSARVPPSKSVAHRALILAALAEGDSRIGPLPEGDDVAATLECLRACGVGIEGQGTGDRGQEEETVVVSGTSGRLTPPRSPLNCRASGTTLRLLMGIAAAQPGAAFTLDGEPQLRRRPVSDLEAPLDALGAHLRYAEQTGFPPVVVGGARWKGGIVDVPGTVSSQFLSGLLLAAPLAEGPMEFRSRRLVSAPYVEMTAAVMARFGVSVTRPDPDVWRVEPTSYHQADVTVEPDASAAAFLWAAAAVTGGSVAVEGVTLDMMQGDAIFPDLLERFGCVVERGPGGTTVSGFPVRGIEAHVAGTPDLVPALVAVAAFAPTPSTFTGVAHLRHKESDRLAVLVDALSRLGGMGLLEDDRITIVPTTEYTGAELDPRGDHRMAMAFAVLGLRIPGTRITQPSCVNKSFPNFFDALESLLS